MIVRMRLFLAALLLFLLTGCAAPQGKSPTVPPLPSSTWLSTSTPTETPSPAEPTSTSSTPTQIGESKPGPPPGYVPPTQVSTPTMASDVEAWQQVRLPEVGALVQIPAEWEYARMPGAYFIGAVASDPWLVVGLKYDVPQDIDQLESVLLQEQHDLGVMNIQTQRVTIGGYNGIALFGLPNTCVDIFVVDIFVPATDVVHQLTFMPNFCQEDGQTLNEIGQKILGSIQFVPVASP